jgi:hypothetical protein
MIGTLYWKGVRGLYTGIYTVHVYIIGRNEVRIGIHMKGIEINRKLARISGLI